MAQATHPWLGFAWLLLFALLLPACGRPELDDDPVTTVRSFLDLMERSGADEAALSEAYTLLDRSAQQALRARAERARSLSGRSFEPWQMLAQGRFRLRFALVSPGGLRARVQGARATVVATGQRPGERAEIPLVREGDAWRIVLSLPPLRSEGTPIAAPAPARQGAR
jgi:hypothetical protein